MAQKKGQAALLLWSQRATEGYPGVKVENFHTSWRDGLAFCALVHHFRPDALEFSKLSKNNPIQNHNLAFEAAEKIGVPSLLEAEDMMIEPKPDQFSVMTYLSQMYHVFEKNANSGGGIANIAVASEGVKADQSAAAAAKPAAPQAKNAPQTKPNLTLGVSKPPPPKLGDLKSNPGMQSSVQMDVSGQNCVKCDQQLSGEVIEAVGKMYHDKCFGCKKCGKKLAAKFLPIEGWPYCDSCGRTAFITSRLGKTSGVSQPADNKPAASNNRQSVALAPQKDEATMLRERREKAEEEMRLRKEKDARDKKEAEEKVAREKSEREKVEREKLEKLEKERLEREKLEKERDAKTAREKDQKDKELKEKEKKEKKDKEQKEKEQKEKENREKEQKEKEKKEKEQKEQKEKEQKEREAKAAKDKEIEREKAEKLKRENEEKAKKESEKAKQQEAADATTTLSFAPKAAAGSRTSVVQPKPLPSTPQAAESKPEPSKPPVFTSQTKVELKPAGGLSSGSQVKTEATKPTAASELQKPTSPPPAFKPEPKTGGLSSGSQVKTDPKVSPSTQPRVEPPPKSSPVTQPRVEPATTTKSSDPAKDDLLKRQQKLDAEREAQDAVDKKNRSSVMIKELPPAPAEKVPEWMQKAKEKQSRLSVMVKPDEKKDNTAAEKAQKDAEIAREKDRQEKERSDKERQDKEREAEKEKTKKVEQEKVEKEKAAKEKEAQSQREKLAREKKEKEEKETKQQQELRTKQDKEKEREREQQELRDKQHKQKEEREQREREQSEKREKEATEKREREKEAAEKRDREATEKKEREEQERQRREREEHQQEAHHTTHQGGDDHGQAPALPERPAEVHAPDPRRATVHMRNPTALMEGFLLKQQPTGFVRFWQQRYFILKEDSLVYFHEQKSADATPSGLIYLRVIDSIAKLPNSRFTIHTSERSYALEADSDAERDLWFETINFYKDRIETKPLTSLMETTAESSNLKKEGWLNRMGLFGFTRVWVTVRGGQLSYAEKQGAKAQSRIQLYHCKLAEYDPVKYPHSFEITPLSAAGSLSLLNLFSSSTVFQAGDDEEMQRWLNAIIVQKLMIEETIDNIELI